MHYHRGSYGLALCQFTIALQHKPGDPVFSYYLTLAQNGNGQKQEAMQTLGKLLDTKAEFAERQKAEEKAEELYSELQEK